MPFTTPTAPATPGDDRFQHQPKLVQLWRLRHYIPVPFQAALDIIRDPEDDWGFLWDMRMGDADLKAKWYYRPNEID